MVANLRLCGNIPESYGRDTTQEKLYSKFTDILLCKEYKAIGLKSVVLNQRGGVADVEVVGQAYSFVEDAKAFRLSRTAKNQKDFKVQAMDEWRYGKPYAMVVCPIYQFPSKTSQIYHQALSRNVCLFTYAHLSLLVNYAKEKSFGDAVALLYDIFKLVATRNPSKSAHEYWLPINRLMLGRDAFVEALWSEEKIASLESMDIAKREALNHLAHEREKIIRMSHDEAIRSLLNARGIERKMSTIEKVKDNGLIQLA